MERSSVYIAGPLFVWLYNHSKLHSECVLLFSCFLYCFSSFYMLKFFQVQHSLNVCCPATCWFLICCLIFNSGDMNNQSWLHIWSRWATLSWAEGPSSALQILWTLSQLPLIRSSIWLDPLSDCWEKTIQGLCYCQIILYIRICQSLFSVTACNVTMRMAEDYWNRDKDAVH